MSVQAVFTQMGIIIGEFIHESEMDYEINNPCLLVTQRDSAGIIPLLALMEETNVTVKKDAVFSGKNFTPIVDVINKYNEMYGSGIVQVHTGTFKL